MDWEEVPQSHKDKICTNVPNMAGNNDGASTSGVMQSYRELQNEGGKKFFYRPKVKSGAQGTAKSPLLSKVKRLHSVLAQYHESQPKSNITMKNISKLQEEMKQDDKEEKSEPVSDPILKDMLKTAKQQTIREMDLLKDAMHIMQELTLERFKLASAVKNGELSKRELVLALHESGACLPLWIGNKNELPPPLCGGIPAEPSYYAKKWDLVAAFGASEGDTWILAQVVSFDIEKNMYTITDIDKKQKSYFTLEKHRIIPLPRMRANPIENPNAIFPREALVLALFPQTTSFYKAAVFKSPTRPEEPYEILFEDRTYETGYSPPKRVAQRYVVHWSDGSANFSPECNKLTKLKVASNE